MKRVFIFAAFILSTFTSFANLISKEQCNIDSCSTCTIENLRSLRSKSDLSEKQILSFLDCCRKSCFQDIEYSEAYNYSMFLLLEKHPQNFVKVISEAQNSIDIKLILNTIENPVSERINLKKVIDALDKVDGQKYPIVTKLLNALHIALDKY